MNIFDYRRYGEICITSVMESQKICGVEAHLPCLSPFRREIVNT
jgi:hypothetical protein